MSVPERDLDAEFLASGETDVAAFFAKLRAVPYECLESAVFQSYEPPPRQPREA